jgi:hypothetical protein
LKLPEADVATQEDFKALGGDTLTKLDARDDGCGRPRLFPGFAPGNTPARMRQTFASETDSPAPLPNPPISA